MRRLVRLADLSDREKESTILVMSGLIRAQDALLRKLAFQPPGGKPEVPRDQIRSELAKLRNQYGDRLSFLERTYVREQQDDLAETAAERNRSAWSRWGST